MAEVYEFKVGPNTATGGSHPEYYSGQIRIAQSPNSNNNTSEIEYWFEIFPNIVSGWHYDNGNQVTVQIDGVTVIDTGNYGSVYLAGITSENPLLLHHGKRTVTHNGDGSKSLRVYGKYRQPQATNMDYILVDGTITLQNTRTNAQITSCPDLVLDGSHDHTVGWSSQSGVYYQVKYKYGATVLHTSPVLTGTGSAMSYTWQDVPVSIASYSPDASSITLTAELSTYSGSSGTGLIGSDTDTFVATYDTSSMGPVIGNISLSQAGLLGTSFVGGKSNSIASWQASAQAGASIASSYAAYATYNKSSGTYSEISGTAVTSGSPATLGTIPNTAFSSASMQVAVKVVVTDSRGDSSTAYSDRFTAYKYTTPEISMLSVERCNNQGTHDSDGGYFMAHLSYSIASLNAQNEKHMGISYYYSSDAASPSKWISPSVSDPSAYSKTLAIGPYQLPTGKEDAVVVLVYVWDAYTSSSKSSKEAKILGGAPFMDGIKNSSGEKVSLAFFKVSDAVGEIQFGLKTVSEDGHVIVRNKNLFNEVSMEGDGDSLVFKNALGTTRLEIDVDGGIKFYDYNGDLTQFYTPYESIITSGEIAAIIAELM